ncbi:MAG: hypothetical protein ACLSVD_17740, partial [Eggerthellaceae bacterium]
MHRSALIQSNLRAPPAGFARRGEPLRFRLILPARRVRWTPAAARRMMQGVVERDGGGEGIVIT